MHNIFVKGSYWKWEGSLSSKLWGIPISQYVIVYKYILTYVHWSKTLFTFSFLFLFCFVLFCFIFCFCFCFCACFVLFYFVLFCVFFFFVCLFCFGFFLFLFLFFFFLWSFLKPPWLGFWGHFLIMTPQYSHWQPCVRVISMFWPCQ